MNKEVLKQALDALREVAPDRPMNQDELGGCVWCGGTPPGEYYGHAEADPTHHKNDCAWIIARAAIKAIEAALGEPEQEPVAWVYHGIGHNGDPHKSPSLIWRPEYMDAMSASKGAIATPLYAAPAAPARAEPTDEQISELMMATWGCASIAPRPALAFARAVLALRVVPAHLPPAP